MDYISPPPTLLLWSLPLHTHTHIYTCAEQDPQNSRSIQATLRRRRNSQQYSVAKLACYDATCTHCLVRPLRRRSCQGYSLRIYMTRGHSPYSIHSGTGPVPHLAASCLSLTHLMVSESALTQSGQHHLLGLRVTTLLPG